MLSRRAQSGPSMSTAWTVTWPTVAARAVAAPRPRTRNAIAVPRRTSTRHQRPTAVPPPTPTGARKTIRKCRSALHFCVVPVHQRPNAKCYPMPRCKYKIQIIRTRVQAPPRCALSLCNAMHSMRSETEVATTAGLAAHGVQPARGGHINRPLCTPLPAAQVVTTARDTRSAPVAINLDMGLRA